MNKKNHQSQRTFDEFLIEAIDETLLSLGVLVKNALYFQLEQNLNIKKHEIPKQIDEFSDIIHKIFGLGASHLEILFMKKLHEKTGVDIQWSECEWPSFQWIITEMSFKEYVNAMRQEFETSNKVKIEMGILENKFDKLQILQKV